MYFSPARSGETYGRGMTTIRQLLGVGSAPRVLGMEYWRANSRRVMGLKWESSHVVVDNGGCCGTLPLLQVVLNSTRPIKAEDDKVT